MKKIIAIALALIMALSLCACGKDTGGEDTGGNKDNETGNNTVTAFLFTEVIMTETDFDGGTDTMKGFVEYDADYNVIGTKTYMNDKLHIEVTYDKDMNKPLIQQEYSENGNKTNRQEYTYDENGNKLTSCYYEADDQIIWSNIYTYDADGNLLSEKYYDRNELSSEYTYTYNEDGKVMTFVTTWPDSDEDHFRKYTYNQQGDLVTETHGYNDQVTYTATYDHVYTDGELAASTGYQNGEKFQFIQYDKDGNKTLECEYANGDAIYRTEYAYENGKLVKLSSYYKGELSYYQQYIYNADGNLTERCLTDSDGKTQRRVYTLNEGGEVIRIKAYDGDEITADYTLTYKTVSVSEEVAEKIKTNISVMVPF